MGIPGLRHGRRVQGDPPSWGYWGSPGLRHELGIQPQAAVGCPLPSPRCGGGLWGAQGERQGDGDGWGRFMPCTAAPSIILHFLPIPSNSWSWSLSHQGDAGTPPPCHSLALLECHHHHSEVPLGLGCSHQNDPRSGLTLLCDIPTTSSQLGFHPLRPLISADTFLLQGWRVPMFSYSHP